ncbi:hypothetical protein AgCh_010667 [Apium graveolens]
MVAQTLPSFAMNVFLLPLELTREIEKYMAKFFWSTSPKNGSKINWMSWDRMAKHKHSGGLVFRNLHDFNLAMLGKWTEVQCSSFVAPLQPLNLGDGATCWVKPRQNEVKITVDAAVFEDKGSSGIGIIARVHGGYMLHAKTKCYSEVLHPTLAEALAIKEALSWIKTMEWNVVTIESDCLVVVQMIRSSAPMRSRLGQVIQECKEIIREANNLKLYFIKRSANMPAHELAHVAHMYPDRIFDWSSVPVKVRDCIQYDLE